MASNLRDAAVWYSYQRKTSCGEVKGFVYSVSRLVVQTSEVTSSGIAPECPAKVPEDLNERSGAFRFIAAKGLLTIC